jgi:hypothetical protein
MTRVVREFFPTEQLPPELRAGLGDVTHVRVIIDDKSAEAELKRQLHEQLDVALAESARGEGRPMEEFMDELIARIENEYRDVA